MFNVRAAGVTDRLWDMMDVVRVVEDWEDARKGADHEQGER